MAVLTLTAESFENEVEKSQTPVLVDFWASWCAPCRMTAPAVESASEEYGGKVKFGKVDVDDQPELARKFGISSIPTLLIFKDGKVADKSVGAMDSGALKAYIDKNV